MEGRDPLSDWAGAGYLSSHPAPQLPGRQGGVLAVATGGLFKARAVLVDRPATGPDEMF